MFFKLIFFTPSDAWLGFSIGYASPSVKTKSELVHWERHHLKTLIRIYNRYTAATLTYDSTILAFQGGGRALRRRPRAAPGDGPRSRTRCRAGHRAGEGSTGAGAGAAVW